MFKNMAPVWPSGSYRFGSVKRDRPPIPPSLYMEAFNMLMIRMVYPPLSTHQQIKKMVCVRKMESKNGKWGFIKNKIGAEWARE